MHPTKIGRYEILGVLGQGGMGIVYDAIDPILGRPAAVKVLRIGPKRDEGAVERFLAEATKIVRLEAHKAILTIYEADMDGSQPYVAMRKVTGTTLEEKLAKGVLRLETVTRVVTAIGGALSFAHRHGIVHCDVKPSNILLDELGQPYLTDFGISRASPDPLGARESHKCEYTPLYASPEQLDGREPTVRSDVYALGVVLYEMCTGTTPYGHVRGLEELRKAVRLEAPCRARDVNPKVPESLDAVIHRAIAEDPRQRFATAQDFVNGYLRAVAGLASAALADAERAGELESLPKTPPTRSQEHSLPDGSPAPKPRERVRTLRRGAWILGGAVALGVAGAVAMRGGAVAPEAARAEAAPTAGPAAASSQPHGGATPESAPTSRPASSAAPAIATSRAASPAPAATAPERPRPRDDAAQSDAERRDAGPHNRSDADPGPAAALPREPVLAEGPFVLPPDWRVEILDSEAGARTGLPRRVRDPRLGLELVLVEPGVQILDPEDREPGTPARTRLVVSRPFYMGVTEVTVGQMRTFAAEKGWKAKQCAFLENPFPAYAALWKESQMQAAERFSDRHPAVKVRFLDATGFCTHYGYRLPTQTEWEYAARAGTRTRFWFGTAPEAVHGCENVLGLETLRAPGQIFGSGGWAVEDGYRQTAPVAALRKNPFGLADMLGNVREWVSDSTENQEIGIACGGAWDLGPEHGMPGSRHRVGRSKALMDLGFRVAREIGGP